MILNLFGLSIKSGEIKTETNETKITGDKITYYYNKINLPKEPNVKPTELPEGLLKLDEGDCC